tara:strand:+ start:416289 stop:416543 length:255 start_codon:yes stop_codon:yes gene_type:complete
MIFAQTPAEKEHDGRLVSAQKNIACSSGTHTIPAGTKGRIQDARDLSDKGTRILVLWIKPEDGSAWCSLWCSTTEVIECIPEGP